VKHEVAESDSWLSLV